LVPDPPLWHALWLNRLAEFVSDTQATLAGWRAEAVAEADAGRSQPRTRARIDRVIAACEEQRARVEALFEDLRQGQPQLLPTRPESGENPLLEFSENLFRDWVWGDKEAELTRALVANLVAEPPGRLAVYGAGAGRLAVDLHQSLAPAETWALDLNPLPFLVAERLVRGEAVTLPEFPVAPHGEEEVVLERELRCPGAVREGFAFAFADALQPPFAPGSLDTVVTGWFIDATGRDFRHRRRRESGPSIGRALGEPGAAALQRQPGPELHHRRDLGPGRVQRLRPGQARA
jgi:hypothetical protein